MHIRKHRKKWQALIRRKGIKTITKSFISKAECSKWARNIERELDRGNNIDYSEANRLTLGDLFKRYIRGDKHKKILSVPELQLVSGHKDPRVLLNTYTKLSAENIAKKLIGE